MTNPLAVGAELRGAGLLLAIGGLYGVLVLGATLSTAAVAIGVLIGVGVAVADVLTATDRGRVVSAAVFVVVLVVVLATDWVVTNHVPGIGTHLASVVIGIGGAGLLCGVALETRERYAAG